MRLFAATVLIYGLSVSAMVSDLSDEYRFEQLSANKYFRTYEVSAMANALKKRLLDGTFIFPVDLASVNRAYYGLFIPSQLETSYAVKTFNSTMLDLQGQQAILFDNEGESTSSWLAINECQAQAWASATDFCRTRVTYSQVDNHDYTRAFSNESQSRLDRIVQQIVDGKVVAGRFPSVVGGTLQPHGTLIRMHQAVGYGGTAQNCTGLFSFDGAVLTCEHLFALDGTPVFYQVNSASNAVLYVNLPFNKLDGQPHRVIRTIQL
jgi:hypothetical protein